MIGDDDDDDDDALTVELATLRAAVSQFQQEAHTSALNFQHHFLAHASVLERNRSLEQNNSRLRKELAIFRANPESTPQSAIHHVQELSLALRRVSDKLSLTEVALKACKLELATSRSDLVKAKHAIDGAYAREEEGRVCEQDLWHRLRTAEQDRILSDHVVQEYADLVRSMEGRASPRQVSVRGDFSSSSANDSSSTLVDSLAESKSDLYKLLENFRTESAGREAETSYLKEELRLCQSQLASEREGSAHDRSELAKALVELENLRIDDNTAAKMVARYMKFSQSTVTSLQSSLTTLTTRHAATQATLLAELEDIRTQLTREAQETARLRSALDELSADLAREAYGRRLEVGLRLALLTREERVCERLRRWIRRSKELAQRVNAHDTCECRLCQVFEEVLNDASKILDAVDGEEEVDFQSSGQLTRMTVAQGAVSMLTKELSMETERRLRLERAMAQGCSIGDDFQTVDIDQKHSENFPSQGESDGAVFQGGKSDEELITYDANRMTPPESLQQAPTVPIARTHDPFQAFDEVQSQNLPDQRSMLESGNERLSEGPNVRDDRIEPIATLPQPTNTSLSYLLAGLARVSERYNDLQRAFYDCHLALQNLRAGMSEIMSSDTKSSPNNVNFILRTVIERLYHYTEDVRVELEIRAADEVLLARGFEALLSIPGAPSPSPTSPLFKNRHAPGMSLEGIEVQPAESENFESDIRAFIDGTEATVQKALQGFSSRLEDIQHDIAIIKLASHDLPADGGQMETLRTTRTLNTEDSDRTQQALASGITTEIYGLHSSDSLDKVGLSDESTSDSSGNDPFAKLGLRIPMPRYAYKKSRQPGPQPRKSSGMHMLGLGLPYRVSDSAVKSKVWEKEECRVENIMEVE